MPRPKKQLNKDQYGELSKLCALHCTGEECAAFLEIDYDTLNRILKDDGHGGFSDYYKKHSARGKMSLRRHQWRAAEQGNVTMLIWLGKQNLGQSDVKSVELSGETVQTHYVVTQEEVSEDDWEAKYSSDLGTSSGAAESTH